jgi:isopenicillin-N N-acyltransferase-like protein
MPMPTLVGKIVPSPVVIKVSGTPYEMGIQHGKQLKPMLNEFLEYTKSSYEKMEVQGEELEEILAKNIEYLRDSAPNMIRELEGISEGAKLCFEDVFAANICGEINCAQTGDRFNYKDSIGLEEACTSFTSSKFATLSNDTFLAMNQDSSIDSLKFRPIVRAEPSNGYKFIAVSRATDNGGYGINEKGVAIGAPTVLCRDSVEAFSKGEPSGIYDRALTRMILEDCASTEEAIEYIKKGVGGYQGLNFLLMDGNGNIAKVERSYNKTNVVQPEVAEYSENYVLAGTNHYTSKEMNNIGLRKGEAFGGSYDRYDRIISLLIKNAGKIDLEMIKTFLRDHHNEPTSICKHREHRAREKGMRSLNSLIAQSQPGSKRLWILWGTPCENKFVPYEI